LIRKIDPSGLTSSDESLDEKSSASVERRRSLKRRRVVSESPEASDVSMSLLAEASAELNFFGAGANEQVDGLCGRRLTIHTTGVRRYDHNFLRFFLIFGPFFSKANVLIKFLQK
jgi:hypothetical protein